MQQMQLTYQNIFFEKKSKVLLKYDENNQTEILGQNNICEIVLRVFSVIIRSTLKWSRMATTKMLL